MALTKVGKEGITGISNSSDATAITIDSSEHVGIGTTSPSTYTAFVSGSTSPGLVVAGTQAALILVDTDISGNDGTLGITKGGEDTIINNLGNGSIKFFNNGSERAAFLADGGLTFNGDSGQVNALDDYEEGTWTPAIYYQNTDDQTNSNNDTQIGFYVKVGTLVTAVCYLKWDATNSRANDNIGVSSLPFIGSQVSGNNEVRYTAPVSYSATSYPQGDSQVMAVTNPGNNLASFVTANGSANLGDEFGQNNNMEVRFTLHYVTN